MKTIKQRISYAAMALVAMGFTACTQNEDMAPTLKGRKSMPLSLLEVCRLVSIHWETVKIGRIKIS